MSDPIDLAQQAEEAHRASALARLHAGGAGITPLAPPARRDCDNCGDAIPKARLKAMPQATLCLPCQELAEGRR